MKTSPENGITAVVFVLGQPPRALPISMAPAYWPSLCTLADAQKTLDAIRAFDTSAKGGPDSVTVDIEVMDFSGMGEFGNIVVPDSSPVRNFCIAGKVTKAGIDYVVDEYGALVPDQLQTDFHVPQPGDVLHMTINASSGVTFHWGPA